MQTLFDIPNSSLEKMQIVDWGYIESEIPKTFSYYNDWVNKNFQGPLSYLSDHRRELRSNIKNYFPEFKSSLVFLFDYSHAAKDNKKNDNHQFAAYTKGFEGMDYHYWIKDKLEQIAEELKLQNYKLSIDTQPVLERDMAYKAGLGWFGKNSMLINKKYGSFFLISSILLDHKLSLPINKVELDHCGTCTRCIDACPTDAIVDNKVIDANKCISTFTIELFKDAEPPKGFPTEREEIFGCDICQDVCPWNSKPIKNAKDFIPVEFEKTFNRIDLNTISNREFKRIFKGTSLERTGRVGILKNIRGLSK